MKCPYCGAKNIDSATFCNLCLKQFAVDHLSGLPATEPVSQPAISPIRASGSSSINAGLLFKLLFIGVVVVFISFLVIKGGPVARDAVKDMMGMSGISTSKGGGIKVKQIVGGKMIETTIGKMPKGFPSDIPAYKGAKIKIGQSTIEQSGSTMFTVVWKSEASLKKIMDFYKTALPQNQYQISSLPGEGLEENGILQFNKFNLTGKLIVSNKGDENDILVNVKFDNE